MLVSFFLSLLIACSNPYKEAESQNTVEAYEKFIKENPGNSNIKLAKLKIENLLLEKARSSSKLEDYDTFLKKYASKKDSENYKDAFSERMFIKWEETQKEDTTKAYDTYIEEYGHTQDKTLITARLLKKIAPYKKDIAFGSIEKEEIDTTQKIRSVRALDPEILHCMHRCVKAPSQQASSRPVWAPEWSETAHVCLYAMLRSIQRVPVHTCFHAKPEI